MRVLVVDDDLDSRVIASEIIRSAGHYVRTVPGPREALRVLDSDRFDAVITDIRMDEVTGIDLLWNLKKRLPDVPVILMTAYPSLDSVSRGLRAGAAEYLAKPLQSDKVRDLLERLAARQKARRPRPRPEQEIDSSLIIGRSARMVEIYKLIVKAARTDAPVLIEGETGTGKELVARALHAYGPRSSKPFLEVNCAAIPETLLESELFGYVKGAFTGADRDKPGLFEQASEGTLFLDEISAMAPALQGKILKAIEQKEVRPVGSTSTRPARPRILSATSRPLRALVDRGVFREDLYYRVNTLVIRVPPLRDRPEDIPLLSRHFLAKYANPKTGPFDLDEGALRLLLDYSWPGNIRELEHCIQRAIVFGSGREVLTREDLEFLNPPGTPGADSGSFLTLREMEKQHILRVLSATDWNRNRTAEILGIDRKSLYRKARRLGISLQAKP